MKTGVTRDRAAGHDTNDLLFVQSQGTADENFLRLTE
jgi:hypothetical protein